jgi:ABC-type lipoprotein export system ATPase subunit
VSGKNDYVIELRGVSCTRVETGISSSIHDVSLGLAKASLTVITGAPGSGKNLLLRTIGLLEMPEAGEVLHFGENAAALDHAALIGLRDTKCGYVFCPPFLLPKFTVMENIAMPLFKTFNMRPIDALDRTEGLMKFVQLMEFSATHIDKLSAGAQLRVGLARALGSIPGLLVVEEPDRCIQGRELEEFRALLLEATRLYGCCVVMSASPELPPKPHERRIEIAEGKIVCDAIH